MKIESAANWKPDESGSLFINDDQLDAIICALPGVVKPEDRLEGDELKKEIRDRIQKKQTEYEGPCEPPKGYCLIKKSAPDNLPKINVCKVNKNKFDKMLTLAQKILNSPTDNQESPMNELKDLIKNGNQ